MSHINFNKFAEEANGFINELAEELGHPENQEQTLIVLRAVLHTLRDRITISESFDVISQLPMILKGIYVEQWKYHEKPEKFSTIEEFKNEVKERQHLYGETRFNWDMPTEEIIAKTFNKLRKYLDEGQLRHIEDQMPAELKPLIA